MLVLDADGKERHRIEGFLPVNDFLPQLLLGLAKAAFAREEWSKAEELYRRIAREFPKSEAAPEALYWAGVARYKGKGDPAALGETWKTLHAQFPASTWASKASVWQ